MSNPTIGIWPLVSDLTGTPTSLTGVDPIRYDDGLWIESAAANLFRNPSLGAGAGDWVAETGVSRTTASLPKPLPGYLSVLTVGLLLTATSAVSAGNRLVRTGTLTLPASSLTPYQAYIYLPSALSATGMTLTSRSTYTGATDTVAPLNMAIRDDWQRVAGSIICDSGDVSGFFTLYLDSGSMEIGETIYITMLALQTEPAMTSPVSGSLGAGWAWSGTPELSISTRAASSASVTISEPAAVACWYREGYSGPKTFAYLEPYGTLGTYGSIAWSGGTLTLSTSRNLVIGPFAAFSRALTANEQANLRSTQNWSMNSVNGSNIILPLSGRRRPR